VNEAFPHGNCLLGPGLPSHAGGEALTENHCAIVAKLRGVSGSDLVILVKKPTPFLARGINDAVECPSMTK